MFDWVDEFGLDLERGVVDKDVQRFGDGAGEQVLDRDYTLVRVAAFDRCSHGGVRGAGDEVGLGAVAEGRFFAEGAGRAEECEPHALRYRARGWSRSAPRGGA